MPFSGCDLRAVPEIIVGGGTFFFQTPPPPGHTWSQSPSRPPGHVSALINPPQYGSNMPWPPRTSYPHPSDTSTKHPPPTGQKSACGPTPQDNFWNSPYERYGAPLSQCRLLAATIWKAWDCWLLPLKNISSLQGAQHSKNPLSSVYLYQVHRLLYTHLSHCELLLSYDHLHVLYIQPFNRRN